MIWKPSQLKNSYVHGCIIQLKLEQMQTFANIYIPLTLHARHRINLV